MRGVPPVVLTVTASLKVTVSVMVSPVAQVSPVAELEVVTTVDTVGAVLCAWAGRPMTRYAAQEEGQDCKNGPDCSCSHDYFRASKLFGRFEMSPGRTARGTRRSDAGTPARRGQQPLHGNARPVSDREEARKGRGEWSGRSRATV